MTVKIFLVQAPGKIPEGKAKCLTWKMVLCKKLRYYWKIF